jgi:hypothetical protein
MINHTTQLDKFFADYEARMNRALADVPQIDVEAAADAFMDCFLEANPAGVTCGQNNEEFRERIPKGMAFYRTIGTKSMTITSTEVTPLDAYHTMVRVHWKASYQKKDGSEDSLLFDVVYFVQTLNNTPKIFAYITGDEQQMYKDHGLVPETEQTKA